MPLNETRQLRRLEAGGTGTHVEFYPVGEHEAHPGTPLWGYVRGAHWHLEDTIEPHRNLGKWHSVSCNLRMWMRRSRCAAV